MFATTPHDPAGELVGELDPLTYLPLVGHVVHQLAARYPRSVDRVAMWNAGASGLLYAIREAERTGMLFSQHAIRVIRASILDTIGLTATSASATADTGLAEGFGIDVEQLVILREQQIAPVRQGLPTPAGAPAPAPAVAPSTQPAPVREPARWTPAAAALAAYR